MLYDYKQKYQTLIEEKVVNEFVTSPKYYIEKISPRARAEACFDHLSSIDSGENGDEEEEKEVLEALKGQENLLKNDDY